MEMPDTLEDIDVLVLAGGRGTRLQALPGDIPKPLRPVGGRPFLSHLLKQVRSAGARRVVLALGYRPNDFRGLIEAESSEEFAIEVSIESTPLGTGGAIRAALPMLLTESVLAMNGDSYVESDLGGLAASHRRRKARMTILLTRPSDASRYGSVEVDAKGAVVRFVEKGKAGAGLINAGIYVMNRRAIEEIPAKRAVSLECEVLPAQVGRDFYAEAVAHPLLDIGTPESYRAAEAF